MSTTSFRIPPVRYLLTALLAIIATHYIVSFSSPTYASTTSLAAVKSRIVPKTWGKTYTTYQNGRPYKPTSSKSNGGGLLDKFTGIHLDRVDNDGSSGSGSMTNASRRANATFVILARNSDLWEILGSIRGMEDRFNKDYNYPYVFLNDELFTEDFKRRTSALASGKCTYGLIPDSQWSDMGEWIDQDKATEARKSMEQAGIIYGGSLPYRKMCRYQSGFFWRHPLLDNYKYYWRIEPSVKYFCNLDYDPFLFMEDNNKVYGWTVSIYEYKETILTLWDETKKFMEEKPEFLAKPNMIDFLSNDGGNTYNLCHFWSNFEIASLDFWRSDAYRAYFDHLDKAGGFFYERWGDAPVHSIAAALFLRPEQMHYFSDIGYRHEPFQHCPKDRPDACSCDPSDSFEWNGYSCTANYKKVAGWTG